MNDIVIHGANAVLEDGARRADIGIEGERITEIGAAGSLAKGKRDIDASGLVALPGLIDMHSHHREPGFTHKEDVITATKCCAAGGVTVSVGMPNISPPPTTPDILKDTFELYKKKAIVDYNMNPAATLLDEIPRLATMGILAFKIFMVVDTGRSYPHMPGIGVHDHGKLLSIFQAVQQTGWPLLVHPH